MSETVHGADLSDRSLTLSQIISRHSRRDPAAPFVVHDDQRVSYDDQRVSYGVFVSRAARLSALLGDSGVAPGDRVAVMGPNSVGMLEAIVAVNRVGGVCVPINARFVADEAAYLLEDSGAVLVVADPTAADTVTKAIERLDRAVAVHVLGDQVPVDEAPEIPVADDAPAFILYTSGTTGTPKGAVLTHRHLYTHTFLQISDMGVRRDDRVSLVGTPLFHIAGIAGIMTSLVAGGSLVLTPTGPFDPAGSIDLLERERISYCFFVPAQWEAICAVPAIADRDLSSLRRVGWGGAPASLRLLQTVHDLFPQADLLSAFGQTETGPVTCQLTGPDALRKIGSVGRPMPGVEVRAVNEEMNDVPQGDVGEIVYRGPTVTTGYWNRPEATAEAFRGGWFHSGDLVRQDEDGFVYVVDRKKDMIISGGENIYSAELEQVLG